MSYSRVLCTEMITILPRQPPNLSIFFIPETKILRNPWIRHVNHTATSTLTDIRYYVTYITVLLLVDRSGLRYIIIEPMTKQNRGHLSTNHEVKVRSLSIS